MASANIERYTMSFLLVLGFVSTIGVAKVISSCQKVCLHFSFHFLRRFMTGLAFSAILGKNLDKEAI